MSQANQAGQASREPRCMFPLELHEADSLLQGEPVSIPNRFARKSGFISHGLRLGSLDSGCLLGLLPSRCFDRIGTPRALYLSPSVLPDCVCYGQLPSRPDYRLLPACESRQVPAQPIKPRPHYTGLFERVSCHRRASDDITSPSGYTH